MAKRIIDLDHEPRVGEKYLVHCLDSTMEPFNAKYAWFDFPWTPIIGVAHNDKKSGFGDFKHMHYDYRFMNDAQMSYLVGRSEADSCSTASPLRFVTDDCVKPRFGWAELKCLRRMPIYGLGACGFMLKTLQPEFWDARIDLENPVCPHHGVCLKNLPVRKGVVTCPAHGLRFSMRTGRMVEQKLKEWMR